MNERNGAHLTHTLAFSSEPASAWAPEVDHFQPVHVGTDGKCTDVTGVML